MIFRRGSVSSWCAILPFTLFLLSQLAVEAATAGCGPAAAAAARRREQAEGAEQTRRPAQRTNGRG